MVKIIDLFKIFCILGGKKSINQQKQSECHMPHDAMCLGSKKRVGRFFQRCLGLGNKTLQFLFLKYLRLIPHRRSWAVL